MRFTNETEAATVACEMEKRAIRLYERARSLLTDARFQAVFDRLLADERAHLEAFERLRGGAPALDEGGLVIAALSGDMLMPGGLAQMEQDGSFESPEKLVQFALTEEREAVKRYLAFAECSVGAARAMFEDIAAQERGHCADLGALHSEVAP